MWYLVESDSVQPAWVEAETELGAKRIHATRYGDDQELTITDRQASLNYERELDTKDAPYISLEEDDNGRIITHLKRVNQAGSLGIYQMVWTKD